MWLFCCVRKEIVKMALSEKEMKQENKYLSFVSKEISAQLEELGKQIHVKEDERLEFKRMLWEEKGSVDSVEMKTG